MKRSRIFFRKFVNVSILKNSYLLNIVPRYFKETYKYSCREIARNEIRERYWFRKRCNVGMTCENYGSLGVQLEPRCASHHEYMQIVTCLLNASAYSLLRSVLRLVASLRVHRRWEIRSHRDDLCIAYTSCHLAELSLNFRYFCHCFA